MERRHQAMRTVAVLLGLSVCAWLMGSPALACDIETPEGYRLDHYRAPTPCELPGARVANNEQMRVLVKDQDAVLIDTTPLVHTTETDFTGRWTVPEPRDNIAGSVWLPNIGYGVLDDEMTGYFADNLERLTGSDPRRPLVFYCFVDCWMSWNAAKRALEFGYPNVVWYPDGTDGWKVIDGPFERATPVPLFEE
ncbi:MAG: PQQ-dependent catabolism-associated CXXCW motif protein [Alphaproteobacteria bacterium]